MVYFIRIYIKYIYLIVATIGSLLLISCVTGDDADTIQTGCPLQLRAEVDNGLTSRSVTALSGTWTVGDKVTVVDETTPHEYTISNAANGTMTGNIFWAAGETTKTITAWSYGGGAYISTLPISWGVSTDQSTEAKLQANDFLYAAATATTPSATASLSFAHKTAKILIRLNSSNKGASSSNVTFTNVTAKVANVSSFNSTTSSWSAPIGDPVSITPLSGSNADYLATYTALVIPQSMSAKELFRFSVTINGITKTYAYTQAVAEFQPGAQYIFDVNFTLPNTISITAITAASWESTSEGTINSTCTLINGISSSSFTPTDDGGIISTNGTLITEITSGEWTQTGDGNGSITETETPQQP
jgi:hypothetical protein